ncbi:hypothetical protein QQF64_023587, partial [Cirrhinus molitorella]
LVLCFYLHLIRPHLSETATKPFGRVLPIVGPWLKGHPAELRRTTDLALRATK